MTLFVTLASGKLPRSITRPLSTASRQPSREPRINQPALLPADPSLRVIPVRVCVLGRGPGLDVAVRWSANSAGVHELYESQRVAPRHTAPRRQSSAIVRQNKSQPTLHASNSFVRRRRGAADVEFEPAIDASSPRTLPGRPLPTHRDTASIVYESGRVQSCRKDP